MRRSTAPTAIVAMLASLLLVVAMAVPVTAAPAGGPPSAVDQVWIVTLEDDHPSTQHAEALVRRHGGTLQQVYAHALNGFSFRGPQQAAENLARNPQVRRVEADRPVRAAEVGVPWGIDRIAAPAAHGGGYTGAGVNIAILDTGIDATHPTLNVAGELGVNCVDLDSASTNDVQGHGTHVAGTAAAPLQTGGFVGAAAQARVVPVKVLDDTGSGSWASIICGVDHVTASLDALAASERITVANMSLGGSGTAGESCASSGLREAICASVAAGVVYVAAAGNSGADAAGFVPAAFPEVISVSALDDERCVRVTGGGPPRTDCAEALASFSNYGAAVDVIAPGVAITSSLSGGGFGAKSGTSMAAPHVAGVAALMRAANAAISPGQVRDLLQGTGECPDLSVNASAAGPCDGQGQRLGDPDGIAEPLVNAPRAAAAAAEVAGPGDGGTDPTYDPPVASFTALCAGLTCTFTSTSSADSALTLTGYSWNFGDASGTSNEANPSHTYTTDGTYRVTLTVIDSVGGTDSATKDVPVTAPTEPEEPAARVTLEVQAYKVKGVHHADLSWSGATTATVDIVRDGSLVATVSSPSPYTDDIGTKGGGSYTYRVCEAGSTVACSADVTANF